MPKTFKLLGTDQKFYLSSLPGSLGGNGQISYMAASIALRRRERWPPALPIKSIVFSLRTKRPQSRLVIAPAASVCPHNTGRGEQKIRHYDEHVATANVLLA